MTCNTYGMTVYKENDCFELTASFQAHQCKSVWLSYVRL